MVESITTHDQHLMSNEMGFTNALYGMLGKDAPFKNNVPLFLNCNIFR